MRAITAPKILIAGNWVEDNAILIKEGVIQSICRLKDIPEDYPLEKITDEYIAPGFFDIQVNGGGGCLLNDEPTLDGIKTVATAHQKFGTTSWLPTLITTDVKTMHRMADAIEEAISKNLYGVRGVHFEGPFLNPDRKGVHNPKFMSANEQDFLKVLQNRDLGQILVTLAPEKTSSEFRASLIARGITIAAGHTNASYDLTKTAIEEGLSGFTHLFNAMPPLLSRDPGVIGAALDSLKTFSGLIADGHHVHPATLKVALNSLTPKRAILVTDAMPPVGSTITEFTLCDLHVSVKDGRCVTAEGTLAGSAISMEDAIVYCLEKLEVTLADAIQMASTTPAHFMGIHKKIGTIAKGYDAEFVFVSETGRVTGTYRH
ncbi:MAG: N-acetylglucosamine-6-phosphate deacetylase [Pseudomonas marincola]